MPEPAWVTESWATYGIGVFAVLLRVISRCMVRRTKWQGDDFLILLALIFYTLTTVCTWMVSRLGLNTTREGNLAAQTDPLLKSRLVRGSKWDYAAFWFYSGTIWTLKICMLFLYSRLTTGLFQHKFLIRFCSAVVGLSYLAVFISLWAHCHPFRLNFEVKAPRSDRCVYLVELFYVIGISNIISDICLLGIPVPLLWKAKLPIRRKCFLSVLLCGGAFIIIASILRMVLAVKASSAAMSPTGDDSSLGYIISWATREMLVAMLVVNAPMMTILRPRFWRTLGTPDTMTRSPPESDPPSSQEQDPKTAPRPFATPIQPTSSDADIERQPPEPKSTSSGNIIAASPDWSFASKSEDEIAGQEYIMPLAPPSATHRASTVTADSGSICDTLNVPPPGIRLMDKGARLG